MTRIVIKKLEDNKNTQFNTRNLVIYAWLTWS